MKKSLVLSMLLTLGSSAVWAGDNYQRLDQLFRTKHYADLEKACQERLKTNPKSLDSLYFLSLMKLNQSKGPEAVTFMLNFEKCHDGIEADARVKKGKSYVLADPYYSDLYYFLGQYYVGQQLFPRALSWLERAQAHYEKDPSLHFFMGRCYAGQGDYGEAVKEFQKQSSLDPKDSGAFYNIASCYAQENKVGDSANWLKKAIAVYPKYKDQASKDDSFKKVRGNRTFQDLLKP